MTVWEPAFLDYYPDTVESYYALGEGRYDLVQVERTPAGWHALLFIWEHLDDEEDDVPTLYADYDEEYQDSGSSMYTLLDEAVFPTEREAKDWCEDHNLSEEEAEEWDT